jgi:light-regulated signal transduction histidine kinase (bacteriophytochrome)
MNEVVEQIKELEVAKTLEETNAIIDVPQELPTIYANPIQIRQLFQNLISNGIKYHAPGVQPRVEITSLADGDDKVRINIKDNGIGIEEKYFTDIFKMFRRLHSRREYEGTGIGLSICKKIVEKHNGTIGIESELGKGSNFWFVLPLMRKKESEQLQEAAQSSNR